MKDPWWIKGANVITDDDYPPLTPWEGRPSKVDPSMTAIKWPGITRNEVKEILARGKR